MENNVEIKKIETVKVVRNNEEQPSLSINKQLFVDHIMFANINRGQFIRFFVYVHTFLSFFLSIIYTVGLLNGFKGSLTLPVGFHNEAIWGSCIGVTIILLISSLILSIYILKYKLFSKKRSWSRLFWLYQIMFYIIFIVGMCDKDNTFIYGWDSRGEAWRSGGWAIVLALFIFMELFEIHEFLLLIWPSYRTNKLKKLLKDKKTDVASKQ